MIPAFQTERLDVRSWAELDAVVLGEKLAPLLTPPVLAHLPDTVQDLSGGIEAWINARDAVSDVFAISTEGALIGLLFLFRADGTGDVHIGYLIAEAAWGRGYATELVTGLVTHWPKAKSATLRAGVSEGNSASVRVLLKAGFQAQTTDAKTCVTHFERFVPRKEKRATKRAPFLNS